MHVLTSISSTLPHAGHCECGARFQSSTVAGVVKYHQIHAIAQNPTHCDGEISPFQIAIGRGLLPPEGQILNPKPHRHP